MVYNTHLWSYWVWWSIIDLHQYWYSSSFIPTRALHPSLVICALDPKPHAPIWCPCHRGHAFPAEKLKPKTVHVLWSCCAGTIWHKGYRCPASQSLWFMPSWWNWSCSPRGSGRLGSGHGRSPRWTLQCDDRSAWSFVIFLTRESTSLGSNRCKRTIHLALKLLSLTKQFCFKVQQKTNTRVVPYPILIFCAQCPTHLQLDLSIFV